MKSIVVSRRSRRGVMRGVALTAAGISLAPCRVFKTADSIAGERGFGLLQSAGVLAFGPNNILFIGDIAGAAVHAFALREKDLTPQTDVELGNFHNFEGRDLIRGVDHKLAALFGTTYDKIVVNDMVVHQPSQQIFLSVERGREATNRSISFHLVSCPAVFT